MRHFLGVSIGWLVAHTQTEDLAIAGKKMSKWNKLPHDKEIDALEQTIVQLISDVFQLKAKAISRQYGGEDIGKLIWLPLCIQGTEEGKMGDRDVL